MGTLAIFTAAELDMDRRAGHELFIGDDVIVVPACAAQKLEYYGGFEYVAGSCKLQVGNWSVYRVDEESEDCRVSVVIDAAKVFDKS